ncbi:MAG: aldose epimerase family protein [Chthoniobacteraceae bacterium]
MRLSFFCFFLSFIAAAPAEMKRSLCCKTPEGEPVEIFTLTNAHGLRARVLSWGATLSEMSVPDRAGKLADVTLGFDEPERYLQPHPAFGIIAGRFANRIALGKFALDGRTYQLATNNGPNHLHGGMRGFDKYVWRAEPVGTSAVRFTHVSADGDEGYPGKLTVSVTYTLTEADELRLDYTATTNAPTVLNLTNHAYWNLGDSADVLAHTLLLNASRYTVVDASSIPTGELRAVAGTPMNFTKAKPIGRDIAALKDAPGGGFDHNWVIDSPRPGGFALAAEAHDPASGRVMRVSTDQPGVQFYTGNYLKSVAGRSGRIYEKHAGFCLETQHFPDSPNQPAFPSTVLRPGQTFRSTTVHAFSVR